MPTVEFDRLTGVERPQPGRSLWRDAWTRLKRNRTAVTSVIGLVLVSLACLGGPLFSPHRYDTVYRSYVKAPPSLEAYPREADIEDALRRALRRTGAALERWEETDAGVRIHLVAEGDRPIREDIPRYLARLPDFSNVREAERLEGGRRVVVEADATRFRFLLGTDPNGRDLLTRILIGGRISLAIGLLATVVALAIGVSYGAIAGFVGGRVDDLMMRFVDILYSLPFIFFVILLVVIFGRNFVLIFVAVGAIEWLDMARIVRGQTLSIKRQEYVEAAHALGVSRGDINRRHIIPNAVGPLVVYMTLLIPKVILHESFLPVHALGVQEPLTSWGVLISEGARTIQDSWWLLVFPSLLLTATLFCLNFLGDGLRDALDPKDRH
jgi:oligopeptide transport system permease protein